MAFVLSFLSLLAATAPSQAPAAPSMADADEHGPFDAGHVTLAWSHDESGGEFELEESIDGGPYARRYVGPDRGAFLSGNPDGRVRYRVRWRASDDRPWSTWSTVREVTFAHHSLDFALALFGLGGVVFTLTAAFVIARSRGDR